MAALRAANLALRFLLELCALAALAYWGAHLADAGWARVALAVALPLAGAVVWGLFAAPKARFDNRPLRVVAQVVVFGGAVVGLAATGHWALAVVLAVAVVVNVALLAAWGQ